MAEIKNMEGLTNTDINRELERGAKFVVYQFCISIVVLTFRRSSAIYFVKAGETGIKHGLGFSLLSFVFGWWGIPWGPIYTIGALYNNFTGGKDVTQAVLQAVNAQAETA